MADFLTGIGVTLKQLTVPVLLGILIAAAVLLFLPDTAAAFLGVQQLRQAHRQEIGLALIVSSALLAGRWLEAGWRHLQAKGAPAVGPLVITPVESINALWWSHADKADAKKLYRQVCGDFNVTNTTDGTAILVRSVLRTRRWLFFGQTTTGLALHDAVQPRTLQRVRVHFLVPVKEKPAPGRMVADVAIEDQLAKLHWVRGLVFKDTSLPMEDQ